MPGSWNQMHFLEAQAAKRTVIHRLHPLAKLLTAAGFLLTVASFGKYAFLALLPLLVYPLTLIVLGDLPFGALAKRALIAAPFALGMGLFNPIFDRSPLVSLGRITITGGWVSFGSIILRTGLMVMTALALVATSGMNQIAGAMRQLGMPQIFLRQLLLLSRYLSVLGEETARTLLAYSLRAPQGRGVRYTAWGSLLGQLVLRTIDRAGRIYQAMLCRGFTGEIRVTAGNSFDLKDAAYTLAWLGYFATARIFDLPGLLGSLLMGVGR